MYADDIAIICTSRAQAEQVDNLIKDTFKKYGLSLNYGPSKSCYMQTSLRSKKHTLNIGELSRVETYQYLGCLITTDKLNNINYKGLTKAQSTSRNSKIRNVAKKFSWMLGNRKTSAASVNNLILSLTRGNLYGVINPKTNLCLDYKTKGSGHSQKWETALRGLIKDTYELPIWTRTEILHTITGIPHFRILLLQETIAKIRRWRYLIGSRSPLTRNEINDLKAYLNGSTLIAKVSALLRIENPLLETTDWQLIEKAVKTHISAYWREIREKTPNISSNQRGGWFLKDIGFQGWKLHCQTLVSILCNKPTNAPSSARTKCPVCNTSHKNFKTCLKNKGLIRKNKINPRLASIILTLKKRNRTDLIENIKNHVKENNEWIDLPNKLKERGQRSYTSRSDKAQALPT